jgi:hypothetical protein
MSRKVKRGTAYTRLYRPGFYASSPAWCRAQNDLAQEAGRPIPYPNVKESQSVNGSQA